MKGRAIAYHLAHCSLEEAEEIQGDFVDKDIMEIEVESWKMYFDGVTNQNGSGIGVLLISPKGTHILISVIFTWFLLSSYLLKLLVFLYFFWFDLICIYI